MINKLSKKMFIYTMGKAVYEIYGFNLMNRLTITPTRITMKIADVGNDVEEKKVRDFFYQISKEFENYPRALRGFLGKDNQIILRDNQMKVVKIFKYE